MHTLDDQRSYKLLDQENIYDSLAKIGRQFESGWHNAEFAPLDIDLDKIKNIVFIGMGGSGLAGYIVHSIAPLILTVPFEITANYRLPVYAGKNSLVILSSYSGNTEEVLSCAQDAKIRGCKRVAITSGGKLLSLAVADHFPLIELDEKYNPSRIPRSAVGLSLSAVIGLLIRINPGATRHFNLKNITHTLDRVFDLVNVGRDLAENPAKALAAKHKGQGVILMSANHLGGVAKLAGNFLNETAKTFCVQYQFPDLNHHLLEGFVFPSSLKDSAHIIIINSTFYPEIIQKRIQITRDVLIKQKYRVTVVRPESSEIVDQVFESLVFFVMFSYYLSILNKANPASNPWVDYLKKELH